MTIDLEQFVGKECIVTLNDDRMFETTIEKTGSINTYPYQCRIEGDTKPSFTREGIYDNVYPDSQMTIKSIQLKNSNELPRTP